MNWGRGVPLLTKRPTKRTYGYIVFKIRSRGWKSRLLNLAGRTTLVQSVVSSIPVYSMQSAWIPTSVCNEIDKLSRSFIWSKGEQAGIHKVGWKEVVKPKDLGGLGVREARKANTALLGKLVWEILAGSEKLWVIIVRVTKGFNLIPQGVRRGTRSRLELVV